MVSLGGGLRITLNVDHNVFGEGRQAINFAMYVVITLKKTPTDNTAIKKETGFSKKSYFQLNFWLQIF